MNVFISDIFEKSQNNGCVYIPGVNKTNVDKRIFQNCIVCLFVFLFDVFLIFKRFNQLRACLLQTARCQHVTVIVF